MKRKKGFAMPMVVVAMIVVMSLSSLVLFTLSTINGNQKAQAKNLEKNLFVSEISTQYANKNLDDFVDFCESKNWTDVSEQGQNTTILISAEKIYKITITQNLSNQNFEFVQIKPQKILANLHKTNGVVDEWHYQIKEQGK